MVAWIILFLTCSAIYVLGMIKDLTQTSLIKHTTILALFYLVLLFFAGFRYQIGNDYDSYVQIYGEIAATGPFSTYVEPGFGLICYALNQLGFAYQSMFFLFAAITLLLMFHNIITYAKNPYLALMLFILLPNYYFNLLCVVRQFLAISIVFYGVKYIMNRQFVSFLLTLLVACLFHKTAIILLPFYFIVHVKQVPVLMVILLALAIIFPLTKILPYISNSLLLADYEQYLNSAPPEFGGGSTLIIRILLFAAVLLLYHKIKEPRNRIICNLYLWGVILYYASIGTEALSRLSLYLMIFEIIALPNIIYQFKKTEAQVLACTYVLYGTLLYFTNLNGYQKHYIDHTSEGNIQYTFNFKFLK
ncbi:EpsG family protein [Olivibacter ginsenosidimutans]|uniref:EpsG family protein n=1 Tax=Olivibacter ginsenosidimutans TaxID=1176537 RepID=A0ABP9AUU0_9SPHI